MDIPSDQAPPSRGRRPQLRGRVRGRGRRPAPSRGSADEAGATAPPPQQDPQQPQPARPAPRGRRFQRGRGPAGRRGRGGRSAADSPNTAGVSSEGELLAADNPSTAGAAPSEGVSLEPPPQRSAGRRPLPQRGSAPQEGGAGRQTVQPGAEHPQEATETRQPRQGRPRGKGRIRRKADAPEAAAEDPTQMQHSAPEGGGATAPTEVAGSDSLPLQEGGAEGQQATESTQPNRGRPRGKGRMRRKADSDQAALEGTGQQQQPVPEGGGAPASTEEVGSEEAGLRSLAPQKEGPPKKERQYAKEEEDSKSQSTEKEVKEDTKNEAVQKRVQSDESSKSKNLDKAEAKDSSEKSQRSGSKEPSVNGGRKEKKGSVKEDSKENGGDGSGIIIIENIEAKNLARRAVSPTAVFSLKNRRVASRPWNVENPAKSKIPQGLRFLYNATDFSHHGGDLRPSSTDQPSWPNQKLELPCYRVEGYGKGKLELRAWIEEPPRFSHGKAFGASKVAEASIDISTIISRDIQSKVTIKLHGYEKHEKAGFGELSFRVTFTRTKSFPGILPLEVPGMIRLFVVKTRHNYHRRLQNQPGLCLTFQHVPPNPSRQTEKLAVAVHHEREDKEYKSDLAQIEQWWLQSFDFIHSSMDALDAKKYPDSIDGKVSFEINLYEGDEFMQTASLGHSRIAFNASEFKRGSIIHRIRLNEDVKRLAAEKNGSVGAEAIDLELAFQFYPQEEMREPERNAPPVLPGKLYLWILEASGLQQKHSSLNDKLKYPDLQRASKTTASRKRPFVGKDGRIMVSKWSHMAREALNGENAQKDIDGNNTPMHFDVYVEAAINCGQKKCTSIKWDSGTVVKWHEFFEIGCEPDENPMLTLTVYNKRSVSRSSLVGRITIPLESLCAYQMYMDNESLGKGKDPSDTPDKYSKLVVNRWLPLLDYMHAAGGIHIQALYIPEIAQTKLSSLRKQFWLQSEECCKLLASGQEGYDFTHWKKREKILVRTEFAPKIPGILEVLVVRATGIAGMEEESRLYAEVRMMATTGLRPKATNLGILSACGDYEWEEVFRFDIDDASIETVMLTVKQSLGGKHTIIGIAQIPVVSYAALFKHGGANEAKKNSFDLKAPVNGQAAGKIVVSLGLMKEPADVTKLIRNCCVSGSADADKASEGVLHVKIQSAEGFFPANFSRGYKGFTVATYIDNGVQTGIPSYCVATCPAIADEYGVVIWNEILQVPWESKFAEDAWEKGKTDKLKFEIIDVERNVSMGQTSLPTLGIRLNPHLVFGQKLFLSGPNHQDDIDQTGVVEALIKFVPFDEADSENSQICNKCSSPMPRANTTKDFNSGTSLSAVLNLERMFSAVAEMAPVMPARMLLSFFRARNLWVAQRESLTDQDPMVRVTVSPDGNEAEIPAHRNGGCHPVWNQTCSIYTKDSLVSTLFIQVRDANLEHTAEDSSEPIGTIELPVSGLVQFESFVRGQEKGGAKVECPVWPEGWLPLTNHLKENSGEAGEVRVQTCLDPQEAMLTRALEDGEDGGLNGAYGEFRYVDEIEPGHLFIVVKEGFGVGDKPVLVEVRLVGGEAIGKTAVINGPTPVWDQIYSIPLLWRVTDEYLPFLEVEVITEGAMHINTRLATFRFPLTPWILHPFMPSDMWHPFGHGARLRLQTVYVPTPVGIRTSRCLVALDDPFSFEFMQYVNVEPHAGLVHVEVIGAQSLHHLFHDPYVRLRLSCARNDLFPCAIETATVEKGGSDPMWENENILLPFVSEPYNETKTEEHGGWTPVLDVQVCCRRRHDVLATTSIPLFPFWIGMGELSRRWYPLSYQNQQKAGSINLGIQFIPETTGLQSFLDKTGETFPELIIEVKSAHLNVLIQNPHIHTQLLGSDSAKERTRMVLMPDKKSWFKTADPLPPLFMRVTEAQPNVVLRVTLWRGPFESTCIGMGEWVVPYSKLSSGEEAEPTIKLEDPGNGLEVGEITLHCRAQDPVMGIPQELEANDSQTKLGWGSLQRIVDMTGTVSAPSIHHIMNEGGAKVRWNELREMVASRVPKEVISGGTDSQTEPKPKNTLRGIVKALKEAQQQGKGKEFQYSANEAEHGSNSFKPDDVNLEEKDGSIRPSMKMVVAPMHQKTSKSYWPHLRKMMNALLFVKSIKPRRPRSLNKKLITFGNFHLCVHGIKGFGYLANVTQEWGVSGYVSNGIILNPPSGPPAITQVSPSWGEKQIAFVIPRVPGTREKDPNPELLKITLAVYTKMKDAQVGEAMAQVGLASISGKQLHEAVALNPGKWSSKVCYHVHEKSSTDQTGQALDGKNGDIIVAVRYVDFAVGQLMIKPKEIKFEKPFLSKSIFYCRVALSPPVGTRGMAVYTSKQTLLPNSTTNVQWVSDEWLKINYTNHKDHTPADIQFVVFKQGEIQEAQRTVIGCAEAPASDIVQEAMALYKSQSVYRDHVMSEACLELKAHGQTAGYLQVAVKFVPHPSVTSSHWAYVEGERARLLGCMKALFYFHDIHAEKRLMGDFLNKILKDAALCYNGRENIEVFYRSEKVLADGGAFLKNIAHVKNSEDISSIFDSDKDGWISFAEYATFLGQMYTKKSYSEIDDMFDDFSSGDESEDEIDLQEEIFEYEAAPNPEDAEDIVLSRDKLTTTLKQIRTIAKAMPEIHHADREYQLPRKVSTWRVQHVLLWMRRELLLPEYQEPFADASIDGIMLVELTGEMLQQDLRVEDALHRLKILTHINLLKQQEEEDGRKKESCHKQCREEFAPTATKLPKSKRVRPRSASNPTTGNFTWNTTGDILRTKLKRNLIKQKRSRGRNKIEVRDARWQTWAFMYDRKLSGENNDEGRETNKPDDVTLDSTIQLDDQISPSVRGSVKTNNKYKIKRIPHEWTSEDIWKSLKREMWKFGEQLLTDRQRESERRQEDDMDLDSVMTSDLGPETDVHALDLVFDEFVALENNAARFLAKNNKLTRIKFAGGIRVLLGMEMSFEQFDMFFHAIDVNRSGATLSRKEFHRAFGANSDWEGLQRQRAGLSTQRLLYDKEATGLQYYNLPDGVDGSATLRYTQGINQSDISLRFVYEALQDVPKTLAEQQLTLHEAFLAFDQNNSGSISVAEFTSLLKLIMTKPISKHQEFLMMSRMDVNEDKTISRSEFFIFFYLMWIFQLKALKHKLAENPSDQMLENKRKLLSSAIRVNFPRTIRDRIKNISKDSFGPFIALLNTMGLNFSLDDLKNMKEFNGNDESSGNATGKGSHFPGLFDKSETNRTNSGRNQLLRAKMTAQRQQKGYQHRKEKRLSTPPVKNLSISNVDK